MSDLINSVTALCKIIEISTGISLRPDLFRLSMMNKLDEKEVQLMMLVLHSLCCISKRSTCKESANKCISSYMVEEGGTVAFLLSPDISSVQLLLCFAWVISHGALEHIIDKTILQSPLGQEVLTQVENCGEIQHPIKPPCEKLEDLINYTAFLAGKINHNLKSIRNYREERIRFYVKVLSETAGCQGLPQLSIVDVQLSQCPGESAEFLRKSNSCLRLIQSYLKWNRTSHFFWQWMESILKEEERFLAEKIQKRENLFKAMSTLEVDHLNKFLKKLEEDAQRRVKSEPQTQLSLNSCSQLNIRGLFVSCGELEELDSKIKNLVDANERKMNKLIFKLEHRNIQEKDKILSILNSFVKKYGKNK